MYHLQDFYDHNLLPKMIAYPHQYVARMISNKNFADIFKPKQPSISEKDNKFTHSTTSLATQSNLSENFNKSFKLT